MPSERGQGMFRLMKPCAKCPFRSDIRPYLTVGRVEEIQESLVDRDETFPCHNTVNYDTDVFNEEGEEIPSTVGSQHCAGAAILLMKEGRPNQMMRIAMRLGMLDTSKLAMGAPIYDSFEDMIEATDERGF